MAVAAVEIVELLPLLQLHWPSKEEILQKNAWTGNTLLL